MRRLLTKQSRLDSRNYQFESLIKNGYSREDYKKLIFFVKDEKSGDKTTFLLKMFKGTAANPTNYTAYRTSERRAEVIQNFKDSHDRLTEWKATLPKGKSSTANCAAQVKAELSAAFPYVKFSVKSSIFAGGDSVYIEWTDGPTSKEVEEISDKYQYGRFNGMEDIYESTNYREDIPQVKYVQERRHISQEVENILLPFAEEIYKEAQYNCHNVNNMLYQLLNDTSIKPGTTPTGIEPTGKTCGVHRVTEFYRVSFKGEEIQQPEAAATPAPVEVPEGEVQVIQYSEKAIAVIGNTKPIKDKLKELGGRFNFRLTCGAGWIFPMSKLEAIKAALTSTAPLQPEPVEIPTEAPADLPTATAEPMQSALMDEVKKTIDFFVKTDKKLYGEISEGTREAARVQGVEIYDNLEDITQAATGGKVISLCNLSQLVNRR